MKSELKRIGHHLSEISSDSRYVKKNSLFLAYPGIQDDGRSYIAEALKKGAKAVLYEKKGFVTISRNIYYKTMKLTK